jgi:putative ABC transport system permease protein
MYAYYLKLGLLSLKRNPILSALMILAIALGIGACMTMITVNYLLSANPIPQKSDNLYYVRLDNWSPFTFDPDQQPDPPDLTTWIDATFVAEAGKATRQTAIQASTGVVEPSNNDISPFRATMNLNYADFFPMFDAPFQYGSGWDYSSDQNRELVIVLSQNMNDRLFDGANSVGEEITISGHVYRIVGVLDKWELIPRFYDIINGAFSTMSDFYIPFQLKPELSLDSSGNTNCWKSPDLPGIQGLLASECVQNAVWVELPNDEAAQDYMTFLNNYTTEQEKIGRFPRPGDNNRLTKVMDWLEERNVVPDDARIMLWLSLLFLVVCLLNTMGLLMAKFTTKSGEIGLRRAIGASKKDLFIQYLIETAVIGVIGGVLGIGLSFLGLEGVKLIIGNYITRVAHLDFTLMLMAISLAIMSSLISGAFPTWRACNVAPAAQLKSQ